MKNRIAAKHNSGFTLIELLVVMAISIILMGLVMTPVVRSFEMTRRAQAMVDAQDSARVAMEQISREIGEAMDVLDYTNDYIDLPVYDPVSTDSQPIYWRKLPYAKIDLVMPKMIAHCNNPAHNEGDGPRDFSRGAENVPECPVCGSTDVDVRPKLPIEQGHTVVRYFLGLRYNSPDLKEGDEPPHPGWQSPYGPEVLAGEGNPVVLYRIEFDTDDKRIFSSDSVKAAQELMDVLQDPKFFYSNETVPGSGGANGTKYWQVWAEKARVIGLAKYQDLVVPLNKVDDKYEAMEPSVTFKYAKVDKDTFAGVDYGYSGSESPTSVPTLYSAKYGYWTPSSYEGITDPFAISVYRYAYLANGNIDPDNTTLFYTGAEGTDLVIYKRVGSSAPSLVFNINQYIRNGGRINLNTIDSNTDMGFCFDYAAGELFNFNRGVVNFALNVEPMVLTPNDSDANKSITAINADFLNRFENVDRNTYPRTCRLPALEKLGNATVVPGSDVVTGPDMTDPADSGRLVRYERVPFNLASAEMNQYRIDYRTGDIFFSRIEKQDLPASGNITIDYKIQFNRDGDVVQGDYQTKSLINVHLGIRMYDPDSAKPHLVELNNMIKVRNAYR